MQTGAQAGGTSGMNIMGTFQDAIALVRSPKTFMAARADIAPPLQSTLVNYVAILALIPLVFTIIGDLAFRSGRGIGYAIGGGILAYIFDLISVIIVAYILVMLAPRFGSVADLNKSAKLVAYVYTPAFLIAILSIVPILSILTVLGLLYGIYILYIGLPIVLKTPTDQVLVYVIVTLVVTFVVYVVIGLIEAAVLIAL